MADRTPTDVAVSDDAVPDDAVPIRMMTDDDLARLDAAGEPGAGGDGPGPGDGEGTDDEGHRSGPSVVVLVGLVAVLALLVGIGGVLVYQRSTTPGADSVDVGFMQDMTTHHQQAVEMANIVAENGSDPDVRAFAREILTFQQYEVGYMEALLEDLGQWPFPSDRTAMEWMGMSSTPEQMPGMQPEAEVEELQDARGAEVEALFIPMMIDHHKGGIHMAEYAAEHASDPRVRSLAERIVMQQSGEIADFERAAERLGVPLD
ncbi:DUF305 domain-containing protein [Dermatobacter hominis]|uniref:DUF305 domain-containing protein n=1 Tax=Dermatobacter hominis TaxID=2884263 RepID=UPI001D107027|nr:DUF305 domain-containing protein [Dermatobacter hominis]UDY37358.1 DUF305 domain-containing protein [Dermatobacter hominis]